jgi:hypothetical protein
MPLSRNSLLRAIRQKVSPLLASASPFFIPPTMYYDSQVRWIVLWTHGCVLCVSLCAVARCMAQWYARAKWVVRVHFASLAVH